jgi:hypothetical protein
MWRDFSKAVAELWHASGEPCSAYRPDKHYMRGPGPKWHAKYDSLYQQAAPTPAPKMPAPKTPAPRTPAPRTPALREIAERHA